MTVRGRIIVGVCGAGDVDAVRGCEGGRWGGDGGMWLAGQDVTFVCWRVFRRGLAAPPAPAAGGHCPPDPLNYGSTAGLGLERVGLAAVDELAIGL